VAAVSFALGFGARPLPLASCVTMLAKRATGYNPDEIPPAKRFRHNVADLFLSNELSGAKAMGLYHDAAAAGAANVGDLCRGAIPGKFAKNAARDLRRRLTKSKGWPGVYWAEIPTLDPKTSLPRTSSVALLLPHELIASLCRHIFLQVLQTTAHMAPDTRNNLARAASEAGVPFEEALGIGLWGDGIASKWDRTESLEVVTLSLPGFGPGRDIRIPLCGISKRFLLQHETIDGILSVLLWSFRALARGAHPSARHDGSEWGPGEAHRAKMSDRPVGVKGFLVELRGDWAWFKTVLRLPAWNESRGCCWLCRATPADIRSIDENAPWRSQRLSHWDLVSRMRAQGLSMSPLFSCPGFRSDCIQIDWLHTADLGVTSDFLGNLFYLLVKKMPGNMAAAVAQLFRDIQAFYVASGTTSRLSTLTLAMIRQPGKTKKKKNFEPWLPSREPLFPLRTA